MNRKECADNDANVKKENQYLTVGEGTGEERRLAYVKDEGHRLPGVIFIPGFMSHKDAEKPIAIHNFCKQHGMPFVRYDPTGLGKSEGLIKTKEVGFANWLQDAEEVLLRLTQGPQLVIGSSMGSWIASLLAKKYPDKFHGLLMLAPSINFPQFYIDKIRSKVSPEVLTELEAGGSYEHHDPKYGPYPISLRVFQEMIPYQLPLDMPGGFPVTCPVTIVHGTQDEFSPYKNSLQLVEGLQTQELQLVYVKGADHHLDTPPGLTIVLDSILKMAALSKL